jgi:Deoxynucleoside kinase.
MNTTFIAVEGPIGVGKSTLAHAIATRFGFHLLQEIVDENPYLEKFYNQMDEWAFQTEMYFLVNRFRQLETIRDRFLSCQIPVVSDYHIFKNLIFARKTLSKTHYEKFRRIFSVVCEDLPQPNLLIYLHADVDVLIRRIEKRGRSFEKILSPSYLEQLSQDYEEHLPIFRRENPNLPVLTFNGNEIDFVRRREDLEFILQQVQKIIEGDTAHEFAKKI